MFSKYLKTLSILKKFLFINFVIFTIIGLFTLIYLTNIEPSLLKKKSEDHINIINNWFLFRRIFRCSLIKFKWKYIN